ncbi:tRNA (adenosine(37)-N6)-threonylcarbamoyltransferase complex dimerization subunit type 1 TsaB [Candidatus Albibeggiatoa sp. nov. BB20]|uniref:tRNA (adenosine(37)-N6)-threonylcarbamoyltransferase complex dimerization subunit type 1 TsaB n=1 Tax=Candidatus Albibeggiatoa sp. nov. BB20 TaxID=3162723 RepID=UPI0033657B46
MKLLALDTSTGACSCALWIDGDIQYRSKIAPRQHADLILAMADELLKQADLIPSQLDTVAFGRGPGSFTGLRIACGVVQGIAFAADIPVAPISSLAALAQTAYQQTDQPNILACIDARMNEVYWGCYQLQNGLMQLQTEEQVSPASQVNILTDSQIWFGAGSGWEAYEANLTQTLPQIQHYQADLYPQAQAILPLAVNMFEQQQVVSAEYALPVYLRNKVV